MNHFFWLGASADADQILVASDQAASRLTPLGFDPSRICGWCKQPARALAANVCYDCIGRWNRGYTA